MKINEYKELSNIIINGVELINKNGVESLYNLNVIVENIRKVIYTFDIELLQYFDKTISYKNVVQDLIDFAYELDFGGILD